ncbi:efflux RND transporter periplasmic adaptor subunit [Pelagibacterium lacus]|uniref:efflux RND transporter periplasmic adaptor subunit n=1 Tax=Pelagibacterium lacus TaxID=2282655 RepID=UPI0013143CBA|nr:efflux RND transporter periplasmic adaptor subunit [Pelagibacterium lacus]
MKLVIRLLIVIALATAAYFAWQYYAEPAPVAAPRTSEVTRGSVEVSVLASGILEARSLVNVGAQVSGRINALHVALGQHVEAGELIAEIDSLEQENAVRAAEAALASAEAQKRIQEANARQAQQTLARSQQLRSQNLITASELEAAEIAAEVAAAQVEQFEAQILQARLSVESANLDLDRTKITAPSAGTVVAVMAEQGQTVNANADTPTIVKIANLDTMIVKAEISEADVPRVRPGQRVYFTILGDPDNEIGATLVDVEPAPDSITSDTATTSSAIYYNGRFTVPNPDHMLRISMTAEVTIVLDEAEDALVVNASAISNGPNGASVLVYDPVRGTTESRPVTVGLNNNITAEIVEGVAEGDLLVDSAGTVAGPAGFTGGGMGLGGAPRGPMMFR